MFPKATLTTFALLSALVRGQQIGTYTAESHPPLTWQTCTAPGSCTTNNGAVVLDANWRWVHAVGSSTNCFTGNSWDTTLCPTGATCAANCALDGANYAGTYGITTSGNSLKLDFVTGSNVGSRVYLMADTTHYQIFQLLNKEFTFTVNVANLPCGLNGALYFSEMSADGGVAAYSGNKAGAQYGTGYCDSQCPRDIKFINGLGNVVNWTTTGTNTGTGAYGSCCNEMDVWEANSISAAYTPHPCSVSGQTMCSGAQCGYPSRYSGVCDPDGCDFNSYRMGATTFYGPHMTVDTTQPFTVVTQFLTSDNTTTGTLSEIRRLYVQNGVVISNSKVNIPGMSAYDSITSAYCTAEKATFGDTNSFGNQGGLTAMGSAFSTGVVLVMSLWDDHAVDMLWLDSDYPTTANASAPGVARGTCATTSGVPATVESQSPGAYVQFSNIMFGPIGSTYSGTPGGGTTTTTTGPTSTTSTSTASTPPSTTSTAAGATQTHYGQCGGQGWTGPTTCASPYTCQYSNPYYSQCL